MTLNGIIVTVFVAGLVSILTVIITDAVKTKMNTAPERVWFIIYKRGYDNKYYAVEAFDDEFRAQIAVRMMSARTPRTKYKLVAVQKNLGQSVVNFNVQRYTDLYQIKWMRKYVLKAKTVKKFQKIA